MGKRLGLFLVSLLLVVLCRGGDCPVSLAAQNPEEVNGFSGSSMYCWDEGFLADTSIHSVIVQLKSLQVTDLYVAFSDFNKYSSSVALLNSNGIDVYYLTGDKQWYNDLPKLKAEIDKVAMFNGGSSSARIKGIVFDVEPYLDSTYKADVYKGFETYVNNMRSAYQYSLGKKIRLVTVIPYWYDDYGKRSSFTATQRNNSMKLLQNLVRYSDRISVMNYYKVNMTEHISTEINYAKQYGREIESIAEFGKVSEANGVDPSVTFYVEQDPLGSAWNAWRDIQGYYGYSKLHFSYHHMKVINELIGNLVKYRIRFVDSVSGKELSGAYDLYLQDGTVLRKNSGASFRVPEGSILDVVPTFGTVVGEYMENNLEDSGMERIYTVRSKSTYTLEVYPKLWNGKKYSSFKSGYVCAVNLENGTEQRGAIVGNADIGYYTNLSVSSDTLYLYYLSDENGNRITDSLNSVKYKDADKVEQILDCPDNRLSLPGGLKPYTCITMNFDE